MFCFKATGIVFLWFWMAMACPNLYSQEQPLTVPTQYYALNEGLSERLVTDIVQTKDGFIWIATSNGLNKFDGYEFVVFNDSPDNPNALSEFYIDKLELTKQGKILIIYNNNLAFFDLLDPKTHQVTKINTSAENGILGTVRQITVDKNGAILVLSVGYTGTYLHRYLNQRQFEVVFHLKETRKKQLGNTQILQLKTGNYLLNDSEKGLRLLSPKGEILYTHQPTDFLSATANDSTYPSATNLLYQDVQGRVWVSFQKMPGVFTWSASDNRLHRFAELPSLPHYTSLWEDKLGNLLFAQTNGNTPFPNTRQLFCLKSDGAVVDFSYLANLGPYIQTVYSENFFKTIFFGIDTGLKVAQHNYSRIKTLLSSQLDADRRGNIMRGITGNSQTVYFAEEGGSWYALDIGTDRLRKMALYDAKTGNPLEITCALDLHLDANNYLWGISCNDLGEGILLKCNPTTGATETYHYPHRFRAFDFSKDGHFWLLAEPSRGKSKLVQFDPKTNAFYEHTKTDQDNPLKSARPWVVHESRDGIIWVGTSSGLVRMEWQKIGSLTYHMNSEHHGKGLKSNTIYAIQEDQEGNLWLGTNNGLSFLNLKTDSIRTYDRKNGLASNTVCGIAPDDKGNLWISTYNGLSFYDLENDLFHSFYQGDGLSHDEFNRFSYYRDTNGRYYFGGVNGLNIFNANDLFINEVIPAVVFTKLVRFDGQTDSLITCYDCLTPGQKITILPSDRYFQLHFMLPRFANPSKNQFKVKLAGYDKGWTYLGNTSFIRYSKLPPGNYILMVQGADANGNWSNQATPLKIYIKRAFHQTLLFYALCIVVVIGILYAGFRYQLEQKLKVERFRTGLSNDLHDELSGLLSGIAMQTDMLQMNSQDTTINGRLRHIGEVSRKAMSKMSDVIWSIDAGKDKVEDLIKRMHEHADDILLPLNIHYSFKIRNLEPGYRIPPKTRQELYLIFKEAINNIAKHSDASDVTIVMANREGGFLLEIQDNGKGAPRQHNGHTYSSGQGLSNIKMRAQRINAKVEITKEVGYTIRLKMRRLA